MPKHKIEIMIFYFSQINSIIFHFFQKEKWQKLFDIVSVKLQIFLLLMSHIGKKMRQQSVCMPSDKDVTMSSWVMLACDQSEGTKVME